MISFLSLLDKLLTLVQSYAAVLKQRKAQRELDALEANPADWFANHFDGLPDESNKDKTP